MRLRLSSLADNPHGFQVRVFALSASVSNLASNSHIADFRLTDCRDCCIWVSLSDEESSEEVWSAGSNIQPRQGMQDLFVLQTLNRLRLTRRRLAVTVAWEEGTRSAGEGAEVSRDVKRQ